MIFINLFVLIPTLLHSRELDVREESDSVPLENEPLKEPDGYIIYFGLSCLAKMTKSGRDIIQEFLDQSECYQLNEKYVDSFPDIIDHWIYTDKSAKCEQNENSKMSLDEYCIIGIDKDAVFQGGQSSINTCTSRNINHVLLWNLNAVCPSQANGIQYIEYDQLYDPKMDIIIMDSGIDATHPEFAGISIGRIWDSHQGQPEHWHGTHIAGIVVGEQYGVFRAKNSMVRVLDVRVLDSLNDAHTPDLLDGFARIVLHLTTNAPRKAIINIAIDSYAISAPDAITNRLAEIRANGGIIITCAGNSAIAASGSIPAYSTDTIAVGNHDVNNMRHWSSNYGPLVDIWAPGVNILSAMPGGLSSTALGTSQSCAIVAGIAANLLANNPHLDFEGVRCELLKHSIRDVNDNLGNTNLPRVTVSCDEYCGIEGSECGGPALNNVQMDCALFPFQAGNNQYVNQWFDHVSAQPGAFMSGMHSIVAAGIEDRRWQFGVCAPFGVSVSNGGSIVLPPTKFEEEWYRGCGSNTAISVIDSVYTAGYEDREWIFKCDPLPQYHRLTNCAWSGWINDLDVAMSFDCPNDGLIRTVYSYFENLVKDRRFKVECCTVVTDSYFYTQLFSAWDSTYINNYEASFDNRGQGYFLCGLDSIHDTGIPSTEDRRFRWKKCRESGVGIFSRFNLFPTELSAEFTRSCCSFNGGNAGITGVASYHVTTSWGQPLIEDRVFTFECGEVLHACRELVNCGWTGYLNNYDGDLNFECPNDGIIRGVWSKHEIASGTSKEDRLWRFECCNYRAILDPPCAYPAVIGPKGQSAHGKIENMNKYLIWIIGALLMVNFICLVVYCQRKYGKGRNGYSIVKYQNESETELSDVDA